MKKGLLAFGLVFLGALLILSLFPQLITPHNAIDQNADLLLAPPSAAHWAGTDTLGRDLLARLLAASRVSLLVSFSASLIALAIGITWGLVAGLGGEWRDQTLMRIVDVLYSIPDLLFYILLGLFLGKSVFGIVIALSSLSWLSVARLSRQEAIKYKSQEFVTAARALGLKPTTIAFKHILPQMTESLFVSMIFKIPFLIALESTLSFIGLGLAPPHASFGTLAKEGFDAYLFYPHLLAYPFVFIFLTVFSFYGIGNYLKTRA